MKIRRRQLYDVPANRLIDVMTSRQFYEHHYHMREEPDSAWFDMWEQTDNGLTLHIIKPLDVEGSQMPRVLRPFLSASMALNYRVHWPAHRPGVSRQTASADCQLWIGKAPVRAEGGMRISEEGGKALLHIELDVINHIPLLGKKIEQKAKERIEKLLDRDYRTTKEYLANNP